ncbi:MULTISPECIES: serine/threonine-protein kinase [unclassified Streptomyces]|uniref:serine/threonine-protein kinase n=1 Tax=unclassified Streptomyces TaxID=2593676 RepID=UPI002E7713AB|nr:MULTISPECIES: serine/threonine-protein kinase [unclassified Streptomyces]MEE1765045.1 serine/threonine-protein kinase [Streptomyces sp. SP18BB07]MEE1837763.1 serine/threonine-protein kinase [Streptomyces sp. SP17KL33]
MSDQRPVPPGSADRAPALRQAGALPLRPGDPDRIGPYVSLGLLGSGGMGRVYLARPADGGPHLVAVKVIRPEYAEDERFRRRFEREASVHGRVRTPRMPRLAGTGFRDELLWMATEFLPGLDLAAAVHEDGPLPVVAVRRLVAELGQALADLSAAGIVHRDLKPSNVLLSAWGAHVIDFGIAKAADASAITGTGNRVGTPAYMSPEYLRTGACDTASDVFSLACALVFAATGSAPFGDGTGVDVMHRVAFEEPNPKVLAEIAEADTQLAALLAECLSKEPDQRPTPTQLIEATASAGSGAQPLGGGTSRSSEAESGGGTGRGGGGENPSWPEPLAGRLRTLHQAYETLRRLPLEQPGLGKAAQAPATTPPPSAPTDASAQSTPPRPRLRRKRLLLGAAGVAVCTATAGVVVLTLLSPATTTASPQRGTTRSADAAPDDDASASAASRRDGANAVPDGGSSDSEVSGKDDRTSADADRTRPDATASDSGAGKGTADDPSSDSSVPAAGSSAPTEPSQEPTDTSTEPSTPTWLTDCTYYDGNGRTRLGDSGDRVLQAQCMLSKRGYGLDVDGEFDADTEAAVRSFQQDKGLLVADGVVRPRVWKALRSTE